MTSQTARGQIGSTFSPPTPNGDFHLGHFAGPVLSSDVFARAKRMYGHDVRYDCSTDDNQTYVVTTARRLGQEPRDLLKLAYKQTSESLALGGVSVTSYTQTDTAYESYIREFFDSLWSAGVFDLREVELPIDDQTGDALPEAFITGRCPHCLFDARAGACEACGLYNMPAELLESSAHARRHERHKIWVLDLERHRKLIEQELAKFHVAERPSLQRIIDRTVVGPLPSIPITYPIAWGIDVTWGGVAGTINAWPEIFAGHLYWLGLGSKHEMAELVQFIGIDNGFYNSFVYTALSALAREHNIARPPRRRTITNHYLQLGGRKFSTSKGDVIWASDFLRRVGRDRARFVLALKAPEFQHAEFTMEAAENTLAERFDAPLRAFAEALADCRPVLDAVDGHASTWWEQSLAASRSRFGEAYATDTFSVRAAAEAFALHLEVLVLGYRTRDMSNRSEQAGAMQFWRDLGALGEPIAPDIGATILAMFAAATSAAPPIAI